jgi:DNA-binding beta-propeller fold protein YncE
MASRIPLGGEAGNTHYDGPSHCIVVAVQTKNELVAIDPASERIVARYAMSCDHPHGFLIDEPKRLAFVTCEGDAKLLVVDLRTMRTTAMLRTADDPDVLALDPGLGRLYVGCESGAVSVFDERFGDGRITLAPVGEYRAPHAHSVSVDPATHRVYVPLQDVNGKPTLRILEARQ